VKFREKTDFKNKGTYISFIKKKKKKKKKKIKIKRKKKKKKKKKLFKFRVFKGSGSSHALFSPAISHALF